METELQNYEITEEQKINAIRNILLEAYATCTSNDNPELVYITAGPGAGKSTIEKKFKKRIEKKGIIPFIINSDKIASYHPYAKEALKKLLPKQFYKMTRKFVRPAAPVILKELRDAKISLINENTLDHGESDIEQAKAFKDAGYKITVNVIATDIFESRLSCFEREAFSLRQGKVPRGCSKESQERMYNSFIPNIRELQRLGLLDEINVYTRGKTINDEPNLVYSSSNDDNKYSDFKEAVEAERKKQRDLLLKNPKKYYDRIKRARDTIGILGKDKLLTRNAINGLNELEREFAEELEKFQELDDRQI